MITRIRSFSAVAALTLALTGLPATGMAYPLSTPSASSSQPAPQDTNPMRTLLDMLALESASLWSALDSVYSDAYVASACDLPC